MAEEDKEKRWLRHFKREPKEPAPQPPAAARPASPASPADVRSTPPATAAPVQPSQPLKVIASNGQKEPIMAEAKPTPPKLRYEDRADLFETFADSVGPWAFDGQTLRFEFTVTRMDAAQRGAQPQSGRRLPVARVALTVNGALELLNHCRQLTLALEKAGVLKQVNPAAGPKAT
jgi:hypothetical protein